MQEFEHETPEEFNRKFWEFIESELISNKDLEANDDWQMMLTYKLWKRQKDSDVDIAYIYTIARDIIEVYKRYEPSFEK